MSTNLQTWQEAVTPILREFCFYNGLTFRQIDPPPEEADIGGGAGICFSLRGANAKTGQPAQIAALTYYESQPGITLVVQTPACPALVWEAFWYGVVRPLAQETGTTASLRCAIV